MQKYIGLFFLAALFSASCGGKKTPVGIITSDRMVSLLTDVHLIDGALYNYRQDPDTLYKYGHGRYEALFKKYHTDSLQFKNSVKYYAAQPAVMTAIYDQIMLSMKKKTDSLMKLRTNQADALK